MLLEASLANAAGRHSPILSAAQSAGETHTPRLPTPRYPRLPLLSLVPRRLQGSQLPSLLQSKLNAPRVLRVNKVADYVRRKMEEHGIALREEPLFWDPAKAERWQAEQAGTDGGGGLGATARVHQLQPVQAAAVGGPRGGGAGGTGGGGAAIIITCGGHTVPWDFSLAAVRQWIWRRSDDLVLHYSVRDHGTPLRLPAIRPPS